MSKNFRTLYQYAIVRFMPFIETREFANIGVVVLGPKTGEFIFRLAPKRFGRVTNFFDDIEGKLYQKAIDTFTIELERVREYIKSTGLRGKDVVEYFDEITRHRESVLHFGPVGRLMGDSGKVELEHLYQRFVAREFVNEEYREKQMVKILKHTIATELSVKYTQKKLKAGVLDIPMPLVYKGNNGYKVIKPLAFEQSTPLKAYEHGLHWAKRVEILINNQVIVPERALFTLERPDSEKSDMIQVCDDIVGEIEDSGVQVKLFNDVESILSFAKVEGKDSSGPEVAH